MTSKKITGIFLAVVSSLTLATGQTSHETDFTTIENWSTNAPNLYTLESSSGSLLITAKPGIRYETADYTFPVTDVSANPYIQVDISASRQAVIRIDFIDTSGYTTNTTETKLAVLGNFVKSTFIFNLTGKFSQTYPSDTANGLRPFVVNSKAINRIAVYVNPSNNASTSALTVYLDNLKIGSNVVIPPPPSGIRVNQVGYYPVSPKSAVLAEITADRFYLVSVDGDTVFTGTVPPQVKYELSGERVSRVDFTAFQQEGSYTVNAGTYQSPVFKIQHRVHSGVAKGLLKYYYFNRASTAIEPPYAENWPRPYYANPASDPEAAVTVHASASTPFAPAGTVFSSKKGWLDAGDFNKYVVNAGITTYTMLALYEHFPAYFDTLKTNIPESANALPDILDEAIWELEWLLTTQLKDGSVYHKITQLQFPGMDKMPHTDLSKRYAVGRSTAATCDFAAVMAQAARIFANPAFADHLLFQGFSDTCLFRAKLAYNWAESNPAMNFTGNPAGVATGTYQDGNASDELAWARTELFITTKDKSRYFNPADGTAESYSVPGYTNVSTLALMSLVHHRAGIAEAMGANASDTAIYKAKIQTLANNIMSNVSPYGSPFGSSIFNFSWGGNGAAGNQGMIMLQAYRVSQNLAYYRSALANLDYILGKNATGYSFVTGFGTLTPLRPHHRISESDGIGAPVPGMLVGGANRNPDAVNENVKKTYPIDPARSYLDDLYSHSTNEPAINYNAGGMYLANGLEAILAMSGNYLLPVSKEIKRTGLTLNLYPNPSKEVVYIDAELDADSKITISDIKGTVLKEIPADRKNQAVSVEDLDAGIYFVSVTGKTGTITRKLVKN